jgi:hypothetical protein
MGASRWVGWLAAAGWTLAGCGGQGPQPSVTGAADPGDESAAAVLRVHGADLCAWRGAKLSDSPLVVQVATERAKHLVFDGTSIWAATGMSDGVMTRVRATDGQVLGTYPSDWYVRGLAFDGSRIWASYPGHHGPGELAKLVAIRPADGAVELVMTEVAGELLFDGRSMWVADEMGQRLLQLSPHDGAVLGAVALPARPGALAFDGLHLWVASSAGVTKVRAGDLAVLATHPLGGAAPSALASDGVSVWVASFSAGAVTRLRSFDGQVLGVYEVQAPERLAFDGCSVWVTSYFAQRLTRLAISDASVLGTFVAGEERKHPVGVAFDGRHLWIGTYDGAVVRL